MSLYSTVSVATLACASISMFGLFGISNCWTKTTTLTTTSMTSDIASISLVEQESNSDDLNIIDNSDNTFKCENYDANSFCIELNVFNTECNGEMETIEITIYGERVASDPDFMSLFSVKNDESDSIDYLSFVHDWKSGATVSNGDIGGLFTAPHCDSTFLLTSQYTDTGIINNIFNDVTGTQKSIKTELADGDVNNWETLTTDEIGDSTSPLKYTIINNINSNTLITKFEASTLNTDNECVRSTPFNTIDGNNDYVIGFGFDYGIAKLEKFEISVTCDGPTPAPTPNCELEGESLCEEFYQLYCKFCDNDDDATIEWMYWCIAELCAECESSLLSDSLSVSDAFDQGCLSTSFNTCAKSQIDLVNQHFTDLGYQSDQLQMETMV